MELLGFFNDLGGAKKFAGGGGTSEPMDYIVCSTVSGEGYSDPTFTLFPDFKSAKDAVLSEIKLEEAAMGYLLHQESEFDYYLQEAVEDDEESSVYIRIQIKPVPKGKFHLIYYTEPNEVQITSYDSYAAAKKEMKKSLKATKWEDKSEFAEYDDEDNFGSHGMDSYIYYEVISANKYAKGGRIKSALMRDRAYKSNEPHELKYKRKTRPKNPRYKKSDSWFAKGGKIHSDFSEIIETEQNQEGYGNFKYRWKVLFGEDVVLKEDLDNRPIKKFRVSDMKEGKKLAEILNRNANKIYSYKG